MKKLFLIICIELIIIMIVYAIVSNNIAILNNETTNEKMIVRPGEIITVGVVPEITIVKINNKKVETEYDGGKKEFIYNETGFFTRIDSTQNPLISPFAAQYRVVFTNINSYIILAGILIIALTIIISIKSIKYKYKFSKGE